MVRVSALTYAEDNCTVTHEGTDYTAGGAYLSDTYARIYVGERAGGKYSATDWHGNPLGELVEVSSWTFPRGVVSSRMYAYRLRLTDGRVYSVRGAGEGMVASGRRIGGRNRG